MQTTAIVNGTFDILHPGHMKLFSAARLVSNGHIRVFINSDASVEKLKGRPPIFAQDDRATMLHNIKGVCSVDIFDSEEQLCKKIERYNYIPYFEEQFIMVKGSDYMGKPITGRDLVSSILFVERTEHASSNYK